MSSVYLSPSTQENNIGVLNYGTEEMRCNAIADVVQEILLVHKVTVYRNRPSMTITQVVNDSNSKKPTLHIAIHTNAYNKTSRGCEVFCWEKNNTKGHILANNVYKEVSAITPTGDRGVKEGKNFYGTGKHMYEVYRTVGPAALTEIAFHDNVDDAKWIINNIKNIGIAISKGILNTLNITYIPIDPNTNTVETILKLITDMNKKIKQVTANSEANTILINNIKQNTSLENKINKIISWIESYKK